MTRSSSGNRRWISATRSSASAVMVRQRPRLPSGRRPTPRRPYTGLSPRNRVASISVKKCGTATMSGALPPPGWIGNRWWYGGFRDPPRCSMRPGEAAHGGTLEHVGGRQGHLEVPLDGRGHLHHEKGVAPQLEEIFARPDPGSAQQTLPERDQGLLAGVGDPALRRDDRLGFERPFPEPPAIHLAVGQPGQLGDLHQAAGNHVVREALRQALTPAGDGPRDLDEGHQPQRLRCDGRVRAEPAGHHRGLLDAGVLQQGRLDLARLDPEASQLDLLVHPSQEQEPPVRGPGHPVPGAVPALRLSRTLAGDESLRA